MIGAIPFNLQQDKSKSLDKFRIFPPHSNSISKTSCSAESPSPSDGGSGSGSGDGIGLEEWESLFPNGDGSLLSWIMDDPDDPADPGLDHPPESQPLPTSNNNNNNPVVVDEPPAAGFDSIPFSFIMNHNHQLMGPGQGPGQGQGRGEWEELCKAGNMIQTGNFTLAQEILARLKLNSLFILPAKKPSIRAAFYVKEAMQMLLQYSNPVATVSPKGVLLTPYDVVHKMDAYNLFSQVSPVTQFLNFTLTQAVLEALDNGDSNFVHVVDFDIGCGAQWAPLIHELSLRKRVGAPSFRITAVAPLSTTHPFQLHLVRENLVQFAKDAGVGFEFRVMSLDLFDRSSFPNLETTKEECLVVILPIWSSSSRPSVLPTMLLFIKQHSPKLVLSFDQGFDRCDTPFPQHLFHSLESFTNLLESLDGVNVASNIVSKIEKFLVQPNIENTVLGRVHAPHNMPHWSSLFTSIGLVPLQFSNVTEMQADYVVKRSLGRAGFRVEKQEASLVLCWQRRELVVASAWSF